MGTDMIPQKYTAEELKQNAVILLTSEQYTNSSMKAASRYTHKAVQYPGMKEQPLQTQRKIALPPKEVKRKTNKQKPPAQYISCKMRHIKNVHVKVSKVSVHV